MICIDCMFYTFTGWLASVSCHEAICQFELRHFYLPNAHKLTIYAIIQRTRDQNVIAAFIFK